MLHFIIPNLGERERLRIVIKNHSAMFHLEGNISMISYTNQYLTVVISFIPIECHSIAELRTCAILYVTWPVRLIVAKTIKTIQFANYSWKNSELVKIYNRGAVAIIASLTDICQNSCNRRESLFLSLSTSPPCSRMLITVFLLSASYRSAKRHIQCKRSSPYYVFTVRMWP